jgi:tetratricopeptide (TPR) repeat protein
MAKETSEIVKLTERVSKDPKSKLFVPLAEEYKKAGDLEMAVYVLTEGLKNNPGYVTARSILGRLLLDQGDLAGSQKELEEVVKVIPDNLLAQRKLGDICILRNNPKEALRYYKSVLALNSRDNEVAAIIADIEAGRTVSLKGGHAKPQTAAEKISPQTIKTQPPNASPSPAPTAPSAPPEKSSPAPAAEAARVEEPIELKKPAAASAAPPATMEKKEEPEDILDVEPLDTEKPEQDAGAAVLDFPSAQGSVKARTPAQEEPVEPPSVAPDQPKAALSQPDLLFTEPDLFKEPTPFEEPQTQSATAENPFSFGMIETEPEEAPAAPPERVAEASSEQADDFTTDTLAELYIAQGFYEKAVDIYERMLVDNPTSRGLKDKLERVKAMASSSSASEEPAVRESTDIFAEPQVYSAEQEPTVETGKAAFLGEPEKERHAAKKEERPLMGLEEEVSSPLPESGPVLAQTKPAYTDFEPREYVPPAAPQPGETKEETVFAAAKSSTVIRKETIHRLEAWLKNIKKET